MECPECKEFMETISMFGTNEEVNVEYHCEKCGTLARLTWNPGERIQSEPEPNGIPF